MGCDIHMYVEVRRNGKWEKIGHIFPYPYHREDEPIRVWDGEEENHNLVLYPPHPGRLEALAEQFPPPRYEIWNYPLTDQPWMRRNYDLFAMLANVRNGRGTAGCDTGDGFIPIFLPRGVPKDATPEYQAIVKSWGEDGHSHSYATLAELEQYFAKAKILTTRHRGYVAAKRGADPGWRAFDEDSLEEMEAEGRSVPRAHSGGVGGQNIVTLPVDHYDKLREGNALDPTKRYYVQVEWRETYYASAEAFIEETLPRLAELVPVGGTKEDVRVVYLFDN